jgi:hypothetical protein
MSLRPPSRYVNSAAAGGQAAGFGPGPLDHEIAAEKAASLGRAGERAEKALGQLLAAERADPARQALLKAAADAVIQREVCGMRRHAEVTRELGIPREVLARLGAS